MLPSATRIGKIIAIAVLISVGGKLRVRSFSRYESPGSLESENHPVTRKGCHPSFVRRGAKYGTTNQHESTRNIPKNTALFVLVRVMRAITFLKFP
jgi:hypothetical protein